MIDVEEIWPRAVELANGTTVSAHRRGHVNIEMGTRKPSLCRAYLITEIKLRILSYSRLKAHGM